MIKAPTTLLYMTSNSVKGQVNRAKELQNSKKLLDDFLLRHTVYDVLPLSFRVVILDVNLLVKKALFILLQNGILYHINCLVIFRGKFGSTL